VRSVIYAHLPQTLSLQPFIEHLYQHEECLKTFSEELTEIFHSFLESHLEIQSYIEDRVKDIELLPSVLEEEEVVASLKELVASISELVDRFSDPHRRLGHRMSCQHRGSAKPFQSANGLYRQDSVPCR
jgi:hypothetical protein